MDAYIEFLRNKDVSSLPARFIGKVLQNYEGVYNSVYVDAESGRVVYAGLAPTSCTSTVAALMLWLCGAEQTLSEEPRQGRRPFEDLADLSLPSDNTLFVFHTPHHKFAILCVGSEACLLHSNQDTFTAGGQAFTLAEYLADDRNITKMSMAQLRHFLGDLIRVVRESQESAAIFYRYFNIRFNAGSKDDYWFTEKRVLPQNALV